MKTIIDTNGKQWEVGDVYVRRSIPGVTCRGADEAQIAPSYGQLNLSPVGNGGNHSGHTFPEYLIHQAMAGAIRLKIS